MISAVALPDATAQTAPGTPPGKQPATQQKKPPPKPAQQTQPPTAPQQQQAAQQQQLPLLVPPLVYRRWTKVCPPKEAAAAAPPGTKQPCFIFMEGRDDGGMLVVRGTIMEVEGEPKKTLIVSFLYGVDLLRGTRIVVDQGPLDATAPYIVCVPPNAPPPFFGCVSQYEITNEMINGMKKGKFLTLQTVFNAQTLSPQLPLADFAKAYDGPPTDLKAEAEAELKLQEELRKRAKQKEEELAKKSGAAPR
ncbi:MAG TPA: invasion associated locus B family protein [Xanthobacteraceae bacterium]|nr:invasion associated locus B family protein [Xanthobacteraceae bacterium]